MGQTIAEKILASHAGKERVELGEFLEELYVDRVLIHDVTGPASISVAEELLGGKRVKHPENVVVVSDHFVCTKDLKSLSSHEFMREFIKRHKIPHAYLVEEGFDGDPNRLGSSYRGTCHAMFAEEGFAVPGELLLGADSHTCTSGAFGMYAEGVGSTVAGVALATGKTVKIAVPASIKIVYRGTKPDFVTAKDMCLHYLGQLGVDGGTGRVLELDGDAVQALSVEEKMTLCNMATEGAFVTAIIPPNNVVLEFCSEKGERKFRPVYSDADAKYLKVLEYDASELEPAVAKPHSPGNFDLAGNWSDVKIDRVYIGSCTGGKLEDLAVAARILYGHRVSVETFIVPATTEVQKKMREVMYRGKTLEQIFGGSGALDATNGQIAPPGCQACLGGPADTLGRANYPMIVISTTNRNFQGRMGDKGAEIYLASPLTAAASAISGRITDPRAYMR